MPRRSTRRGYQVKEPTDLEHCNWREFDVPVARISRTTWAVGIGILIAFGVLAAVYVGLMSGVSCHGG